MDAVPRGEFAFWADERDAVRFRECVDVAVNLLAVRELALQEDGVEVA
jgi:hypothetical protein